MKQILFLFAFASTLVITACGEKPINKSESVTSSTSEEKSNEMEVNPVYEIAVRMVKDGMKADFETARTNFINQLTAQEGVSNDREFSSFYALPSPDEREVFIGMTQYASAATTQAIQSNETVMGAFGAFAQTMDLKAYVFVQPIAGGAFDLGTLAAEPGQVLEVAVRRIKAGQEEAFQTARKAFVNKLDQQDGVLQSWEFGVVAGQNTEGLTVGMTVYENMEKFQTLAQGLQSWPEAAFFGTFDPVALQYAVSVK